jgi:hypothetical protein
MAGRLVQRKQHVPPARAAFVGIDLARRREQPAPQIRGDRGDSTGEMKAG